jgi:hypothetical protein
MVSPIITVRQDNSLLTSKKNFHVKTMPQRCGLQEEELNRLRNWGVKDYLVHMLETRKLSRGTYRGYVAGIKFLYKTTVPRMGPVALYEHMRIFFISIVVNFPKIQNTFYTCLQIPGKNQNL